MKINRQGSEKNYGTSTVVIDRPSFAWDSVNCEIMIKQKRRKDFKGQSKHNYEIILSLEELAQVIDLVSGEPSVDAPDSVAEAFTNRIRSLARLIMVSAGGVVS